jgi:hypothetical protein
MTKITEQMGNDPNAMVRTYTNLNEFDNENSKFLIEIFEQCMKTEVDPNPLSEQLAKVGNEFINDLLTKLENDANGTNSVQVMKICTLQVEIHQ